MEDRDRPERTYRPSDDPTAPPAGGAVHGGGDAEPVHNPGDVRPFPERKP